MPLPIKVTPFGRSPRFRDRFPQKFCLPPSPPGDVHIGTRYPIRHVDLIRVEALSPVVTPVFIRDRRSACRVEEVSSSLWRKLTKWISLIKSSKDRVGETPPSSFCSVFLGFPGGRSAFWVFSLVFFSCIFKISFKSRCFSSIINQKEIYVGPCRCSLCVGPGK